jgi:hypothetical protein
MSPKDARKLGKLKEFAKEHEVKDPQLLTQIWVERIGHLSSEK